MEEAEHHALVSLHNQLLMSHTSKRQCPDPARGEEASVASKTQRQSKTLNETSFTETQPTTFMGFFPGTAFPG